MKRKLEPDSPKNCDIPSEIWVIIALFLNPIDSLNILKTCKNIYSFYNQWKELIKYHYLDRQKLLLIKELKRKKMEFLIDLLNNEENSAIVGSFPLRFISNKKFRYGDIDIFLPWKETYKNDNVNNIIYDKYYIQFTKLVNYDDFLTINNYNDNSNGSRYYYPFLAHVKLISTITSKKVYRPLIQFVFIDPNCFKDIKTYTNTYFDLSFCCSWFDGKKLDCDKDNFFNILNQKGTINFKEIDRRKSVLNEGVDECEYHGQDIIERVKKYKERGFIIDNENVFT